MVQRTASVPEFAYSGCSVLADPARQPCRGVISGVISTAARIQRFVLLIWKEGTIPIGDATPARGNEGRKGSNGLGTQTEEQIEAKCLV